MGVVMIVLYFATGMHHHNEASTMVEPLQYVRNEAVRAALILSEVRLKRSQFFNCLLDVKTQFFLMR